MTNLIVKKKRKKMEENKIIFLVTKNPQEKKP